MKKLRPNSADVAAKVVDGEAILINLSNGMYYSMDSVGGLIWSMIEQGHDLGDVAATIERHYEVDRDTAERDVQALARALLDEGLVVPSDGGSAPDANGVQLPPAADGYAPPQLNKFDDMVDLFALDPPLPELSKLDGGGTEDT